MVSSLGGPHVHWSDVPCLLQLWCNSVGCCFLVFLYVLLQAKVALAASLQSSAWGGGLTAEGLIGPSEVPALPFGIAGRMYCQLLTKSGCLGF